MPYSVPLNAGRLPPVGGHQVQTYIYDVLDDDGTVLQAASVPPARRYVNTGRFIGPGSRPVGFQFGAWSEEMSCTPEREDWTQTGWHDYFPHTHNTLDQRLDWERAQELRERSLSREPEDLPHCVTKATFKLNEILLLGGGLLVLFILTSN